jgi:Putative papain-like cysteine peptidase (DUF1796)
MKWTDGVGAYGAYVSLGSTCQTAYQLRRLQLRKFAGPLDWFISRDAANVSRLIRNRFEGFMEFDRLQVLGTDADQHVVGDNRHQVVSYHDFPLRYHWTDTYPDFKQKVDRRIKALITAAKKGSICFIRTDTSKSDAQRLHAALGKIVPGKFRLLIVNETNDYQEVTHGDWGLRHVGSVWVPRGRDWRGSDHAWDQIMSGFTLKQGGS